MIYRDREVIYRDRGNIDIQGNGCDRQGWGRR
jgi:hypothetical protein